MKLVDAMLITNQNIICPKLEIKSEDKNKAVAMKQSNMIFNTIKIANIT